MPRLPAELTRLAYPLTWRGTLLRVEVTNTQASYTIEEGDPLEIAHWGEKLELEAGETVSRPLPEPPELEPVGQPPGRAPLRRRERVRTS